MVLVPVRRGVSEGVSLSACLCSQRIVFFLEKGKGKKRKERGDLIPSRGLIDYRAGEERIFECSFAKGACALLYPFELE